MLIFESSIGARDLLYHSSCYYLSLWKILARVTRTSKFTFVMRVLANFLVAVRSPCSVCKEGPDLYAVFSGVLTDVYDAVLRL